MKANHLLLIAILSFKSILASTCSFDLLVYPTGDCSGTAQYRQRWSNIPVGIAEPATEMKDQAGNANGQNTVAYVKILVCNPKQSINLVWFEDAAATIVKNG